MEERFIDLHTHSLASDGTDTPSLLAVKAAEAGVAAFAITDHDTVSGVEEAMAAARANNIECIAGCEIAVKEERLEEIHILGLWVDIHHPGLVGFLDKQMKNRFKRNQLIVSRLRHLGCDIDLDEVMELAGMGTCGRPHIARTLVSKGYAPDVPAAFARFLGAQGSAYIPRLLNTAEESIGILVGSGATVVLAHPCLSSKVTPKLLNTLLKKYIAYGLHGIEAMHSVYTPYKQRLCLRMAGKHSLLVSGGSDYHGAVKSHVQLGFASHGQRVPYRYLDTMKAWRVERGLPV